ncbi:MAG: response regulator transcription factor, partial [Gordonia amarae]
MTEDRAALQEGDGARIMLVDDDPLVRSGLRLLLGGQADLTIVAEAANGQEAIDLHAAGPVDLLLMDLRMPVLDGIAATRVLKALPEPPAILVLTTFDADDYVVRALAVGADGFLLKDTDPPDIVAAIRGVLAGRPALSPSVTAALIK